MPRQTQETGTDVEVTPEMIEAGVAALANHDVRDGEWDVIVEDIFTEMIRLWKVVDANSDSN